MTAPPPLGEAELCAGLAFWAPGAASMIMVVMMTTFRIGLQRIEIGLTKVRQEIPAEAWCSSAGVQHPLL